MPLENNTRIAKNTLMLYLRMFLTMGVSLYTSRVVLNVLGVKDFGIYSIVGGIVVLFSFLNVAMSSATQRFLNFELGKGAVDEVERVFSMSMTAHLSIAVLVIIISETIGLWFLNTHLNIPEERMNAANWVYQFSVISFCTQIIRVPYNASIVAYEKMSFYAFISMAEVVLKLLVVFILFYSNMDRLILYSILTCSTMVLTLFIYKLYCIKVFTTCQYRFFWDGDLYKKLMSFSGWSLFGGIANVSAQQGLNILLNIFWGVTVNAAMSIANQVSGAVYGFVSNFQIAFNPQIVKYYASNDQAYFMNLIFRASKFSYFLMLLLALPVLVSTDAILDLWLLDVPEHAASFCRIVIAYLLIDALSAPLWMSVQATGKIRNYQLLMGSLILLNLPLAYLVIKAGFQPENALFIRVIVNLLTFFARIVYLRPRIGLPAKQYIFEVLLVIFFVTLFAFPLPLIVNHYTSSFSGLIYTTITAFSSTALCVYMIGLKKSERDFINSFSKNLTLFSR